MYNLGGTALLSLIMVAAATVQGQTPPPDQLADSLRQGGYVLVMRHASSPREAPPREKANADNTRLERQLDEAGRRGASDMGAALRRLRIPIGTVQASPTYRARETVRLAGLNSSTAVDELGDGGQSMQGVTDAQATWLRERVTETPPSGKHAPGHAPAKHLACVSRVGRHCCRWRNGGAPAGW